MLISTPHHQQQPSAECLAFRLLIRALAMYTGICYGRNLEAREALITACAAPGKLLVPNLKVLCWIVEQPTLPSSLRATCLDLISTIFVEHEAPNQASSEQSLVRHTRLWRKITHPTTKDNAAVDRRASIGSQVFNGEKQKYQESEEMHMVKASLTKAMHGAVQRLRAVKKNETPNLQHANLANAAMSITKRFCLSGLVSLENDLNDVKSAEGQKQSKQTLDGDVNVLADLLIKCVDFSTTDSAFDSIKIEALATLRLLFDMRVDCRMSMVVRQYEEDFEVSSLNVIEGKTPPNLSAGTTPGASGRKGSMFSFGDITKAARQNSLTDEGLKLGSKVLDDVVKKSESDESTILDDETAKKLHQSLFIKPLINATDGPNATDQLTERLTTLCVHPNATLRQAALSALYRHMAQRAFFIAECKRITILVQPEAVLVYHSTLAVNIELNSMTYSLSQSQPDAIKRAVAIIDQMVELITPDDEKPGHKAGKTHTNSHDGSGILARRGSVLTTKESTVQSVVNHQEIMRAIGVHNSMFKLLQFPLVRVNAESGPDSAKDPLRKDLFAACYRFLRLFCRKNTVNQEIIFANNRTYLGHVGVLGLNPADTIAEAVRDNQVLTGQVTEKTIRFFVESVVHYGKKARWMDFLSALVIVQGRPIKRNQDLVVRVIMEQEQACEESVLELDGDQGGSGELSLEGDKKRSQLMLEREDLEMGPESHLLYHTRCVFLLANACVNNVSAQNKLREVLPLNMILGTCGRGHWVVVVVGSCYKFVHTTRQND